MSTERVVLATVTEAECKAMRRNDVCRRAIQKLIREAVNEWEDQALENDAWWTQARKKYGLGEDRLLKLNYETREITEVPNNKILERISEQTEAAVGFRARMSRLFGSGKE